MYILATMTTMGYGDIYPGMCMYVYVCTYMYVCVYTYIHTNKQTNIHAYIHTGSVCVSNCVVQRYGDDGYHDQYSKIEACND